MASFEDKVEALRRLRERRQAREDCKVDREVEKDGPSTQRKDAGYPAQDTPAAGKNLVDRELPAVLEHYAGLQGLPEVSMTSESDQPAPSESAVDSDEADALYCLGHCFEHGLHDCEQDFGKAATYYQTAAEKGSAVGQWRLGHLYEYGSGVDASDAQAAHWYRLAAQAGHPHAQSSLALLLEDGRASAFDDGNAFHWHLAAAAQDHALSQYCVAQCLARGNGAAQDEVAAMTYLKKSAANGFPPAVEALSQGTLWNHAPEDGAGTDEASENGCEKSLLDIAARVAKQMEHLPDTEAEAFLEEFLNSMDVPSALGTGDLEEMLAGGGLDLALGDVSVPAARAVQCAAAA